MNLSIFSVRGRRRDVSYVPNHIVLGLLVIFAIGPMVVLGFNSLKSRAELGRNPLGWPRDVLWSNYPDAWVKGSFGIYLVNSLTYTVAIVAGSLIIATLAAFPIARGHLRGSNYFYLLFLSGILIPAGIIPQFFIMQQLGIYDTRLGYILLWWSRIALPIFIITGFIKTGTRI